MRRNYLILTVLVVSCILFLQIGCQGQAKVAGESKPELAESGPSISDVKPEAAPQADRPSPKITFEKTVHDFGKIGPGTRNACKFKFTNSGDDVLKIGKVQTCCGIRAQLNKKEREYAPGESGTLTVKYHVSKRPGRAEKRLYVPSNDKANPRVALTIKARIVPKVDYQPKKLKLSLRKENAGCPEITISSLDEQPFAIKRFRSTANCITVDYDPSVKKTKFVLQPKVDIEKLRKNLNGRMDIKLTHPECGTVIIYFSALAEFKTIPHSLVVYKAEPEKPIRRIVWILNNYEEVFEVESATSQKGIIKVLSRQRVGNRYKFELEITPPVADDRTRIFTDVFNVNIKGGKKLRITCRGFYRLKQKKSSRTD